MTNGIPGTFEMKPGELQIKRLWDEGMSTRKIGREIGRTKNAVVGRVHRLRAAGVIQDSRSSPILYSPLFGPPLPPKVGPVRDRPTLPPLASVAAEPAPEASLVATPNAARKHDIAQFIQDHPAARQDHRTVPRITLNGLRPQPIATPIPKARARIRECCWPMGDPGTSDFCYCDVSHTNAGSYCDEHHKRAYGKQPTEPREVDPLPRVMAGYR